MQGAGDGALAGPYTFTSLEQVLQGTAQRLQGQFAGLLRALPEQPIDQRPPALLHFLHGARQQLLRAAALLNDPNKLIPVRLVAETGSVLDVAATHARALQSAADELYAANQHLKALRVPLFDVASALDALSTGNFSALPSRIEEFRGQQPLEPARQQLLVNQLNHMLYARLTQAHLPPELEVVSVANGAAVVRCAGLYEAKLSLHQQPYPPQFSQLEAPAAQQQQHQQQQDDTQHTAKVEPGTAHEQQQQQGQEGKPSADEDPPKYRWQWVVLGLEMLAAHAQRPPLRPEQSEQLLKALRTLMWQTADVAALRARERAAAGAGESKDAGAGRSASEATTAQPSTSGLSYQQPALSGLSSLSGGASGVGHIEAGRGLHLARHALDEVASPLLTMHGVLRDLGASLLLDAAREASRKLVELASPWASHVRLERAQVLSPGLRLRYWLQAPLRLALQAAGGAAAAAPLPAVEIGVGGVRDGAGAAPAAAAACGWGERHAHPGCCDGRCARGAVAGGRGSCGGAA